MLLLEQRSVIHMADADMTNPYAPDAQNARPYKAVVVFVWLSGEYNTAMLLPSRDARSARPREIVDH